MPEEKFHVGVKALITNEKNEILVLRNNPEQARHNPKHWDLPGGRIEGDDSIETTLRKGVKEELGVDHIEIIEHFDTNIANLKIPLHDDVVSLMMIVFRCKIPNNMEFKLSFEHLEYKWASVEEAKELLKVKFANSFIEKLDQLETS